ATVVAHLLFLGLNVVCIEAWFADNVHRQHDAVFEGFDGGHAGSAPGWLREGAGGAAVSPQPVEHQHGGLAKSDCRDAFRECGNSEYDPTYCPMQTPATNSQPTGVRADLGSLSRDGADSRDDGTERPAPGGPKAHPFAQPALQGWEV